MLTRAGEIKLAGWGLQRSTGLAWPTSRRLSEEDLGERVDARADVFRLAALAYELITGTRADLDLGRSIDPGKSSWYQLNVVTTTRFGAPVGLDAVLMRALALNPVRRHPSCTELGRELAAVSRDVPPVLDAELARWLIGELPRSSNTVLGLGTGFDSSPPDVRSRERRDGGPGSRVRIRYPTPCSSFVRGCQELWHRGEWPPSLPPVVNALSSSWQRRASDLVRLTRSDGPRAGRPIPDSRDRRRSRGRAARFGRNARTFPLVDAGTPLRARHTDRRDLRRGGNTRRAPRPHAHDAVAQRLVARTRAAA